MKLLLVTSRSQHKHLKHSRCFSQLWWFCSEGSSLPDHQHGTNKASNISILSGHYRSKVPRPKMRGLIVSKRQRILITKDIYTVFWSRKFRQTSWTVNTEQSIAKPGILCCRRMPQSWLSLNVVDCRSGEEQVSAIRRPLLLEEKQWETWTPFMPLGSTESKLQSGASFMDPLICLPPALHLGLIYIKPSMHATHDSTSYPLGSGLWPRGAINMRL